MTIKFTLPDKNTVQIKSSSASTSPVVKNGDGKKYANGQTVTYGLTKNSQWAGSAANAIYTQPMFFSPLHTPQNWQIASKRKEIYQWSFINPCYITCYDGSLKLISDFYNSDIPISSYITRINEDEVMVQDGHGNFCLPDRASKRFMKKQSNEIKVMGVAEPLIVTHDHKCMIIKREDIKCRKSKGNNKLCVSKNYSKTCKRHNCDDFDNKDYIISKIDARDVKKGDFVLVPFSTKIIDSVIENESQARYAGHLASDGWVCDGNNNSGYEVSGICYNQNEREYVIDCIDKVYNNFNIISNHEASNRSGTLLYKRTSNSLAVEFAKKLVKGKGSDKKFTDQVTLLDPNLQLYVLGAYIQSDGAFNNANQCIEITTYSKHLANQLLLMFFRCGILARVNKQPISISNLTFKTNNEYRYIINVPSSECFKIAEYVPGKLDNKIFKRCRDNKRFIWKNYVISAVTSNREFDYEGYVYDIRVPSTYTVTANGVGVHQSRFYYENEPKIAAGVDFYSIFPMNGFTLECKDKKVLKFFEHFANKIELNKICMLISHENHLIGDVFPFAEIQCDVCGGSGQKADGSPCNHPNGKISRVIILNPDWIEVQTNVLASEPVIVLIPDEELRLIIQRQQPKQIYDRLPKRLIELVSSGHPIPLSNRCVSHIKNNASPYGVYGTSMVRRCFTILAYKTKLMTANWIVAERLILPIRIVKIGNDERPATSDDLADASSQIASVANDPNLTIVTHHAFDFEWVGATGKIHNITQEIEQIGKEILDGLMLNQALLNGEMGGYCHSEDTLTLTDSGFKHYLDINKNDKIGCYNPNTGKLEYYNYIAKHVFDYSGEMVSFKTDKIDIKVTPNHRMFVQPRGKRGFRFVEAKDVKKRAKLIQSVTGFDGNYQKEIEIGDETYSIYDFCQMVGYYVSEGSVAEEKRKNRSGGIKTLHIHQSLNSKARSGISKLYKRMFKTGYESDNTVSIYKPALANYLAEHCGRHSYHKRLPSFIKNLSSECLEIVLKSLIDGDGSHIYSNDGRKNVHYKYYTSSDQLAKDVEEIAFKCGYTTSVSYKTIDQCNKNKKHNKDGVEYITKKGIWIICISKNFKGKYPTLESKKAGLSGKEITREKYDGKVYCFSVPHGLFVTKRNDKITIQGNSSAQVGVETMIRRLESWRNTLADWIHKHLFLPMAMMQGFVDEEESKELGETKYLYPTVKFNDMNLRDKSNHYQQMINLHDKKLISSRRLLSEFDIDYDQQLREIREEELLVGPQGQMAGAPGGAMGGMDLGMGGMDLGMGAMGGALPAGGMDLGGGMDMGAPGAAPSGDPMPGVAGGFSEMGSPTAAASSIPPNLKITKRGKATKQEEKPVAQPRLIRLTGLERQMYKALKELNIPYQLYGQYQVPVPGNERPYLLDFAYPSIGVAIESDGKRWHEDVESKIRDQQRDIKLANVGWRVLRFKESAIENRMDEIKKIIYDTIVQASKEKYKNKKASASDFIKIASSLTTNDILYSKEDISDLGDIFMIGVK